MRGLRFTTEGGRPPRILCLGAHCDDIEIGCGGTVLRLLEDHPGAEVTWLVCTSNPVREKEARRCAAAFLRKAGKADVAVLSFRDGFLPQHWAAVKEEFESLKKKVSPDLIFTHYRQDLHQDHRVVSELTWNTFRNHFILEYEIPKFDGDMGAPNVFVPLKAATSKAKISHALKCYRTQAGRAWFTEDLFLALLRIRGMECNAPAGLAEAFYGRKVVL